MLPLQVDLAMQPGRRTEMILNSGDPPKATLPQLHVNDKVHTGTPRG